MVKIYNKNSKNLTKFEKYLTKMVQNLTKIVKFFTSFYLCILRVVTKSKSIIIPDNNRNKRTFPHIGHFPHDVSFPKHSIHFFRQNRPKTKVDNNKFDKILFRHIDKVYVSKFDQILKDYRKRMADHGLQYHSQTEQSHPQPEHQRQLKFFRSIFGQKL